MDTVKYHTVVWLFEACFEQCTCIGFIDSTSLQVCHNRQILRYRLFESLAPLRKLT
ncbi:hypothetical protein HCG51_08730 [Tolypothrix sp. PCC 7910]|uniref:transposase n=1 Tax=Tolypothrix sp. PCC 7910 TaxID=2099387 RepID=UPI00142786AF|nr:hypothetical protein HCG51_08730 [Tolypothrix sp. PCC 7910]